MAARTKQVNIRVSSDEYARLQAAAEKAGMQLSAFVRDAALRKRIKSAPCMVNAEAWIVLGKTLNNLNQLARHLNAAARRGDDERVQAVLAELDILKQEVRLARERLMEAMK